MTTRLFTVFDPATSQTTSANWLRTIIFILCIPAPFWVTHSRQSLAFSLIISFIFKEFKVISPYSFSNIIIFNSLFTLIIINNFMGLFPYIFTASSHITFALSLSLTLWTRIIIYRLTNFFNETIAHLTPQGTPSLLIPFIVIIESIRLIIRPLTLAIRLRANIIAGHLLLTLLGRTGESIKIISILRAIILSQTILFVLEIAVSIIQAYVFSILAILYRREC